MIVAATPLSAPLLSLLHARRRAFDAVDDWRSLPSMRDAMARVEAGYRAASRADVVTSVSDVLTLRLQRDFGMDAITVGNGVDPMLCGDAPRGLPPGPFAVYVGNVQERVDLDLVEAAARHVPVVIAGPATPGQAERLTRMPVTWLGPVHVEHVPGLLSAASVGLLPHRRDMLTESMAPMKLLEYAAAGLPVVSTSLPGLDGIPRVTVADEADQFARLVETASREGRLPPSPGWLAEHDWGLVSERLFSIFVRAAGQRADDSRDLV